MYISVKRYRDITVRRLDIVVITALHETCVS